MSMFGGLAAGGGGYSNTNNPIATAGPATNNSINNVGNGSIGDLNRLMSLIGGPSELGGYTPPFDVPLMRRSEPGKYLPFALIGGGLFVAWLLLK